MKIKIFEALLDHTIVTKAFKNFQNFYCYSNTMSLPSDCQSALDALNEVGARLKAAKDSGDDSAPILVEYKTAQSSLDAVIRPVAESTLELNFFGTFLLQSSSV